MSVPVYLRPVTKAETNVGLTVRLIVVIVDSFGIRVSSRVSAQQTMVSVKLVIIDKDKIALFIIVLVRIVGIDV